MGEAKRRGTYQQRKAAAIERNKQFMRDREAARPRPQKLTRKQTRLLGMIAGIYGMAGLYRMFDISPTDKT